MQRPPRADGGWWECQKCHGLVLPRNPANDVCPAGAQHVWAASNEPYVLRWGDLGRVATQMDPGWRWCRKCSVLYQTLNTYGDVCAAGGSHDPSMSPSYVVRAGDGVEGMVGGWQLCSKCMGLFNASSNSSHFYQACPAGGDHERDFAPTYFLRLENPPIRPEPLDKLFDWRPVDGTGGKVRARGRLILQKDGNVVVETDVQDTGGGEYNVDVCFAVLDWGRIAWTDPIGMGASVHVAGKVTSGQSRQRGAPSYPYAAIAANWNELSPGAEIYMVATAQGDRVNFINTLVGIAGTVLGVVSLVAS